LLPLALMVGFVEESVFRGLMLTALRERGVWRAIIVTSVLFGLTHLANVLAGATVLETISQVAYTIAFGVAFAALVLSTGIIWPLVLAHAAIDAAYFLQVPGFAFSTTWTLIINLGVVVVFTGYGIVVMRRDPGLVATESGT
jgi:membrane protease YdiL (CAAX protease family)